MTIDWSAYETQGSSGSPATTSTPTAQKRTPTQIVADVIAGTISREDAIAELKAQGLSDSQANSTYDGYVTQHTLQKGGYDAELTRAVAAASQARQTGNVYNTASPYAQMTSEYFANQPGQPRTWDFKPGVNGGPPTATILSTGQVIQLPAGAAEDDPRVLATVNQALAAPRSTQQTTTASTGSGAAAKPKVTRRFPSYDPKKLADLRNRNIITDEEFDAELKAYGIEKGMSEDEFKLLTQEYARPSWQMDPTQAAGFETNPQSYDPRMGISGNPRAANSTGFTPLPILYGAGLKSTGNPGRDSDLVLEIMAENERRQQMGLPTGYRPQQVSANTWAKANPDSSYMDEMLSGLRDDEARNIRLNAIPHPSELRQPQIDPALYQLLGMK